MVTLFNDEKRTYKTLVLEDFKARMVSFGKPTLDPGASDWYYVVKKREVGKKLFNFKTTKVYSAFTHKGTPLIEFPDEMLIATDIPCPRSSMAFFTSIFKLPIPKDLVGVPLQYVETMQINPNKTVLGHETLSATPKKFTNKDLAVPANYKKTDSDADVYTFGLDGF